MHESFSTQEHIPHDKEVLSREERGQTFEHVKALLSDEEPTLPRDVMITDVSSRLGATSDEMAVAQEKIDFPERSVALEEAKKKIKAKFIFALKRALLPISVAFAMGSTPVFAKESQSTEQIKDVAMPTMQVRAEQGDVTKLTPEMVFDFSSPLAQSSESWKKMNHKISGEELVTLRDLHEKALGDKNEWSVLSGRNTLGQYVFQMKEMGAKGGDAVFEQLESNLQEMVATHTHPVALGTDIETVRDGQLFLQAPSPADIKECLDKAATFPMKQRVVDPRGVWEYTCDPGHVAVQEHAKITRQFSADIQKLVKNYHVSQRDGEAAWKTVANTHPDEMYSAAFLILDGQYPGIHNDVTVLLHGIEGTNLSQTILKLGLDGFVLTRSSVKDSDDKVAQAIRDFIQDAGEIGVSVSYQPFKEPPVQKK